MPFGMPSTQFPKEERHDIRETFADSLSQCVFDGQTLRLELCSTRLDEAKPPPARVCCAVPTKNLEFRGALAAHAMPRSG